MRKLRVTFLLLLVTTLSHAQQADFDLTKISFKGLAFSTTKKDIINLLGQAETVYTNYDCGFFSNDQEGAPYYQLKYEDFNYIGSDKERFYLENVNFDLPGQTTLKYGNQELNGETSRGDFIKIFGAQAKDHFEKYPQSESLILFSKGSDDGGRFVFKGGKLLKFEYWTPC